MNNVEIDQVEVTKLLGVTVDRVTLDRVTLDRLTLECKLSWSKHIDTTVAKMGRSMSIIKRCLPS